MVGWLLLAQQTPRLLDVGLEEFVVHCTFKPCTAMAFMGSDAGTA